MELSLKSKCSSTSYEVSSGREAVSKIDIFYFHSFVLSIMCIKMFISEKLNLVLIAKYILPKIHFGDFVKTYFTRQIIKDEI